MITRSPLPDTSPSDRLRDELVRQADLLRSETPVRAVAAGLAYGMTAIYLPPGFILTLAFLDLVAEIVAARLLRDPDRLVADPRRRQALVALTFLIETCFALPAALLWHIDDPYAKALSIGLLSGSMMHIATVRAIHMPQGIAGAAALALLIFSSNLIYWVEKSNWDALLVTSLCGVVSVGYFLTAMVSNHRLHRANAEGKQAALRADEAKGRFLAQMSHELRTPLNGILGLAHAELRNARDPAAQERLSVLLTSAEGLATILDDSLDSAAVSDGQVAIRQRPAVPGQAIATAAALFRPRIEEAGLRLTLDIGPGLDRPFLLDDHRLRQCLSNLLSNALRHTQTGGIRIVARLARLQDPPRTHLSVEVADTGTGIAPALRDQLLRFPPGRAGVAPVPRPDGGQGLGLGIVRDLARRMGGDLVLLPELAGQRGARFFMTILLADAVDAAHPPDRENGLQGLRVLVVDDLATNRLVALTCLRLLGVTATEAASGTEALARLRGTAVDAVLLDMNMPDMDGIATLQAIRAEVSGATLPAVIAMTADAMPEDRARYLAAGLDGYLAKPVTPERIAEVLSAALARTRHEESPADRAANA
jgi:two-component system, sensor histidine kinase